MASHREWECATLPHPFHLKPPLWRTNVALCPSHHPIVWDDPPTPPHLPSLRPTITGPASTPLNPSDGNRSHPVRRPRPRCPPPPIPPTLPRPPPPAHPPPPYILATSTGAHLLPPLHHIDYSQVLKDSSECDLRWDRLFYGFRRGRGIPCSTAIPRWPSLLFPRVLDKDAW